MQTRNCENCGQSFTKKFGALFCSQLCRQRYRVAALATCTVCGVEFGYMGRPTRARVRKVCGDKCRTVLSGRARGKLHVGQRRPDARGYMYIKLPAGDPLIVMSTQNNPWIYEHRVVMARELGRPLTSSESVHHINGIKTDNRPENLQLMSGRQHGMGSVARCADCGSSHITYEALP